MGNAQSIGRGLEGQVGALWPTPQCYNVLGHQEMTSEGALAAILLDVNSDMSNITTFQPETQSPPGMLPVSLLTHGHLWLALCPET